jgi:hypothetical protein
VVVAVCKIVDFLQPVNSSGMLVKRNNLQIEQLRNINQMPLIWRSVMPWWATKTPHLFANNNTPKICSSMDLHSNVVQRPATLMQIYSSVRVHGCGPFSGRFEITYFFVK